MKVRLTLLTENNKVRKPEHTEEVIKTVWETLIHMVLSLSDDPSEKCTVESVEVLDE